MSTNQTKDILREIRDRTKRIETRLTQTMVAQGIPTRAQQPEFFPGSAVRNPYVLIPSPHTSIKEVVDSIPENCNEEVGIYLKGEAVARLRVFRA